MNTNLVRQQQGAVIDARVSSEKRRLSSRGTPQQASAVGAITFAIRWRNEPGHTVYRLCLWVGEEPPAGQGSPQAQLGMHRLCGFNKETTLHFTRSKGGK